MHDAWSAVSTSPISNLFLYFGGKVKLLKRSLHFHLFKKCLFRRELFLFIKTVALMFHSYKSSAFRLWCSVKTSVWAIIDQFKAFHQKHMATSLLKFLYSQPTVGFSTKIQSYKENSKLALVSCSDALRGWVSSNSPNSESCTSTSPFFH